MATDRLASWDCRCGAMNRLSADECEACGLARSAKAPQEVTLPKPLPSRPLKGTPMYEMGLKAAAFISKIQIGGGIDGRDGHRQHLVRMAKKYPGVGWEVAILEWDGHCQKGMPKGR